MGIAFFWLVLSIAVGVWAHNKGHTGVGWFFLALVISPLLAGIFCALSKDRKAAARQPSRKSHVKCPACAEFVLPEATICKHCHGPLVPQPNYVAIVATEIDDDETRRIWIGLGIFVTVILIIVFATMK